MAISRVLMKFVAWAGIIVALGFGGSSAEEYVSGSSLKLASPTLEVNFPARRSPLVDSIFLCAAG